MIAGTDPKVVITLDTTMVVIDEERQVAKGRNETTGKAAALLGAAMIDSLAGGGRTRTGMTCVQGTAPLCLGQLRDLIRMRSGPRRHAC
jgi:hypothetical protein